METYTKRKMLEWLEQECELRAGFEDAAYDLFQAYDAWCLRSVEPVAPLGVWTGWMKRQFQKEIRVPQVNKSGSKRRVFFIGVRLKSKSMEILHCL